MTLIEVFLKNKRVQKTLSTKPGEEGFSLIELVVVIAVLAILSAVAIPSFTNVQANARASAVQNGLVNGIKECFVLQAENSATTFSAAKSFASPKAFRGFEVKQRAGDPPQGGDSCFGAIADADSNANDSDFEIYMDGDGVAVKTCSHGERAGCTATAADGKGAGTW
ncbi:Tfp pilus assembly protein FimT/FimU [Prochlorococcus marinus]|uniref:Fimbrial protein n=1 Tax=Prochlorococcus marinus str. GP2 TaxID=59925 RepID=A0A0A1ZHH4_PROMR|nr:prepilin-type N-terminal cleavage/methylation domain-containing protein [Prochlorococcus marinus]KGF87644.1 hypothetical protein EU91_0676 [Prochlorococcus marinus str. GP2]